MRNRLGPWAANLAAVSASPGLGLLKNSTDWIRTDSPAIPEGTIVDAITGAIPDEWDVLADNLATLGQTYDFWYPTGQAEDQLGFQRSGSGARPNLAQSIDHTFTDNDTRIVYCAVAQVSASDPSDNTFGIWDSSGDLVDAITGLNMRHDTASNGAVRIGFMQRVPDDTSLYFFMRPGSTSSSWMNMDEVGVQEYAELITAENSASNPLTWANFSTTATNSPAGGWSFDGASSTVERKTGADGWEGLEIDRNGQTPGDDADFKHTITGLSAGDVVRFGYRFRDSNVGGGGANVLVYVEDAGGRTSVEQVHTDDDYYEIEHAVNSGQTSVTVGIRPSSSTSQTIQVWWCGAVVLDAEMEAIINP